MFYNVFLASEQNGTVNVTGTPGQKGDKGVQGLNGTKGQVTDCFYSGIPILRTPKINENWFEKSESLRNQGKTTVFD